MAEAGFPALSIELSTIQRARHRRPADPRPACRLGITVSLDVLDRQAFIDKRRRSTRCRWGSLRSRGDRISSDGLLLRDGYACSASRSEIVELSSALEPRWTLKSVKRSTTRPRPDAEHGLWLLFLRPTATRSANEERDVNPAGRWHRERLSPNSG